MNVVIDRAEFILGNAALALAGAAHLIARREALTAADLAKLTRVIVSTRATLDEVEAETSATRTGLTVDRADWNDRNEIAAERAAATGVA